MPVIAIIGAGPGMGLAIAKKFGAQGFRVALGSRTPERLDPLVKELATQRIEATTFQVNVFDHASVAAGLATATDHFGAIDVLEFSPVDPSLPRVAPSQVTHENAQVQIDFYVHGAIAAVSAVLPAMLVHGSGTILFTTGASSVFPNPMMGNIGPAAAWLRNWALALHAEVAPQGVQVAHVAINAWIGRQPGAEPDAIAQLHWELHSSRDDTERVFSPPA